MGTPHFSRASVILLFLSTQLSLLLGASAGTYWGDTEVLRQLKSALDPSSVSPGSCVASWDFAAADPCDALFSDKFTCGFRCDATDDSGASRLTELALDQAGYSGPLASVSWDLPYLQTLDLSGNYFTGPIPGSLSNLTRLSRLALSRNSLSGPIPDSVSSLSNLGELYLDSNALEGSIPASLGALSSLTRLQVQSNKLNGELPAALSSLGSLLYLDASDNAISGEVPRSLPPSLVQFTMRNNALEGQLAPDTLQLASSLQVLDLSHNKLAGPVPSALFTHPSLQQLTLSSNGFDSIQSPISLFPQSELIAIDLSNNRIRGFLPTFMAGMPRLSALALENNEFSGLIPTEYALRAAVPAQGAARLERLLLGGNYLMGPIPGPLLGLRGGGEEEVRVSLAGNCLYRCPARFFFCQGGDQRSEAECKSFGPVIP
ncbi:receptor-like protein 35 [Rhodamnia argentea]|uniref:Receptor-like protein 35 n=1 Tax=Rhodamnia argentea TaxID=178133 RepID=A0A8B8NMP7_9MYRT|nr:receptor-like protein 35 [Rhodamnia argentea]